MNLCGDSAPLRNPSTGSFLTCQSHLDECPPGGYCFKSIGGPVCCDAGKWVLRSNIFIESFLNIFN